MTREARELRAVACITEPRGAEWASPQMVRAMLQFADDELERAAVECERRFRLSNGKRIGEVIRALPATGEGGRG